MRLDNILDILPIPEAGWDLIKYLGKEGWKKFKGRRERIEQAIESARNFMFRTQNDGKHDNLRDAFGRTCVGEFDGETCEEVVSCSIEEALKLKPHENHDLIKALKGLAETADKRVKAAEKARATADKLVKASDVPRWLRGPDRVTAIEARTKAYAKSLEVSLLETEALGTLFDAHGAVIDATYHGHKNPGEESAREILDILEVAAKRDEDEGTIGEDSVHLSAAIDLLDKESFLLKVWRTIRGMSWEDVTKMLQTIDTHVAGAITSITGTLATAIARPAVPTLLDRLTDKYWDTDTTQPHGLSRFLRTFRQYLPL